MKPPRIPEYAINRRQDTEERCRCKKKRYATRAEAKRMAREMKLKQGWHYRVYKCGPFFHVTSDGRYKEWKNAQSEQNTDKRGS